MPVSVFRDMFLRKTKFLNYYNLTLTEFYSDLYLGFKQTVSTYVLIEIIFVAFYSKRKKINAFV